MITLKAVYLLAGAAFAAYALMNLRDRAHPRRLGNAAFWALMTLSMWGGDALGDFGNGLVVLGLATLAGLGLQGRSEDGEASAEQRAERAARFGNGLFAIALVIPLTALVGTFVFRQFPALVDSKQVTLIALGLGVLLALALSMAWLRPAAALPFEQGRRLMDSVGWAAVLPQMLASLGAVFAMAGVGKVVGGLIEQAIPDGSRFGAVLAYGLGMALFTLIMGNAFAAFPVMLAAIGLPLLIGQYHGDPAVVAAIGMLAGFCGTLMTPMAANFNLVPVALLRLEDQNAVIRRQIGTALPLLAVNILFIHLFAFR